MRVFLLILLLVAPVGAAGAATMDELGASFNAAMEARDYEAAKAALVEMIALGEEQELGYDRIMPMHLALVRLQFDTNEREPVLPGYAKLYAMIIDQPTPDWALLAGVADEWVGASSDWGRVDELEAQLADKTSAAYGPVRVRLAAAYRLAFDFVAADRSMQAGLEMLATAPASIIEAAALVQNDFTWRTFLRHGMYAEAQAEMQVALSLLAPVRDEIDAASLIATITHNLAEATLELGDRPTAQQLALAAMSERARIDGSRHPKVAESAVIAARASDKLQEEFDLLMQAISIYNEAQETRGLIYDLLIQRADLLRRADKPAEAQTDIAQVYDAYGVGQALDDMNATRDPGYNRQIARILGTRSAIRAELGETEGAYVDSLLSEKFFEYADGSGVPAPEDPNLIAEWQSRASIDAIYQKIDTSKRAITKGNPDLAMESAFNAVALASTKLVVARRYSNMLGGQYLESRSNFRNYRDLADQFIAAQLNLPSDADHNDALEKSFRVFAGLTFSSTSSAMEMVEERETATGADAAKARHYFDTVAALRALQDNWLTAAVPQIAIPGAKIEEEPFGFARRFSALVGEIQRTADSMAGGYSLAESNIGSAQEDPYELRALLHDDEVLVGLYCNAVTSTAWVIRKTGLSFVGIKANCAQIREMVRVLRTGAGVGAMRGPTPIGVREQVPVVQAAYDAYITLFEPLEFDIGKATRILFVPTGDFIGVPWSMLVTERPDPAAADPYADARWLVRDYAVTIVPSLRAFQLLRKDGVRPHAPQPYLGIGNPVLGTGTAEGTPVVREMGDFFRSGIADLASLRQLPELPETAAEIANVATTLGADAGAQLIGAAATEAAVKALGDAGALRNYRVLHFATHGLVAGDLDGLVEPALVLSLPSAVSLQDDGLLTASEISTLDLNADWAILSACNTAAGATASAAPLSGLARAFLYAGARALLVSQWPVESQSAVDLITSTFDFASGMESLDRAEALQLAMLEMIDSGRNDPALWAPFFVVGD